MPCVRLDVRRMFISTLLGLLAASGESAALTRSQNIALVPNAEGRINRGGVLPTGGFPDGYSPTFTNVDPLTIGSTDDLSAFDTVALVGMCDIGSPSFLGNPPWNSAISAFVADGGKLIIWDSECQNTDYSQFVVPFATNNPGALGAQGSLGITEETSLSRSSPTTHPRFVDAQLIGSDTDAVGDANVFVSFDPRWCVDMKAINASIGQQDGLARPTHTYAGTTSLAGTPFSAGLVIYNGLDKDNLAPGVGFGSASGPENLARVWLFELLQPFSPDNLACTVAASCGNGTIDGNETCDPAALPTGCTSGKNCDSNRCICVTPPVCGDGFVDAPELCDPRAVPTGCSSPLPVCNAESCLCEDPVCGNGTIEAGEQCDGSDSSMCPGGCLPPGDPNECLCPRCGDDVVNRPIEQCDGIDQGACVGDCNPPGTSSECRCEGNCGNGIVEEDEEDCDPPNDALCTSQCRDRSFALYRVRLGLKSCKSHVDGAESGDDLWVSLRHGHKVWLNRPIKDLKADGTFEWYDILPTDELTGDPEITHVRDIEYLEIGKTGDDGWCVSEIQLLFNDAPHPIFTHTFLRPGHFLDNGEGQSVTFRVDDESLRGSKHWKERQTAQGLALVGRGVPLFPPQCRDSIDFHVGRDWVRSVVEASVAHGLEISLIGDRVDWNDDGGANHAAVEISRRANGSTTEVDLDLEVEVFGHPAVDVNFELAWSCDGNGRLVADPRNLEIDVGGFLELFNCLPLTNVPLINCMTPIIENVAEHLVRGQLGGLDAFGDLPLRCLRTQVTSGGGVNITFGAPPDLPTGCD